MMRKTRREPRKICVPARCSRAHVGKFAIAYHTWDDPFKRIVAASRGKPYRLLLPLIGEPVALPIASDGESLRWWEAGR